MLQDIPCYNHFLVFQLSTNLQRLLAASAVSRRGAIGRTRGAWRLQLHHAAHQARTVNTWPPRFGNQVREALRWRSGPMQTLNLHNHLSSSISPSCRALGPSRADTYARRWWHVSRGPIPCALAPSLPRGHTRMHACACDMQCGCTLTARSHAPPLSAPTPRHSCCAPPWRPWTP